MQSLSKAFCWGSRVWQIVKFACASPTPSPLSCLFADPDDHWRKKKSLRSPDWGTRPASWVLEHLRTLVSQTNQVSVFRIILTGHHMFPIVLVQQLPKYCSITTQDRFQIFYCDRRKIPMAMWHCSSWHTTHVYNKKTSGWQTKNLHKTCTLFNISKSFAKFTGSNISSCQYFQGVRIQLQDQNISPKFEKGPSVTNNTSSQKQIWSRTDSHYAVMNGVSIQTFLNLARKKNSFNHHQVKRPGLGQTNISSAWREHGVSLLEVVISSVSADFPCQLFTVWPGETSFKKMRAATEKEALLLMELKCMLTCVSTSLKKRGSDGFCRACISLWVRFEWNNSPVKYPCTLQKFAHVFDSLPSQWIKINWQVFHIFLLLVEWNVIVASESAAGSLKTQDKKQTTSFEVRTNTEHVNTHLFPHLCGIWTASLSMIWSDKMCVSRQNKRRCSPEASFILKTKPPETWIRTCFLTTRDDSKNVNIPWYFSVRVGVKFDLVFRLDIIDR